MLFRSHGKAARVFVSAARARRTHRVCADLRKIQYKRGGQTQDGPDVYRKAVSVAGSADDTAHGESDVSAGEHGRVLGEVGA